MRRRLAMAAMLLLVVSGALAAHDLFLKPDNFFVAPGGSIAARVLNGTFSKSENAVARDRLRDITSSLPRVSERAVADTTIDYESKWATLTFGVR